MQILNVLLSLFFIYLGFCASVGMLDTVKQDRREKQPTASIQQRKTTAMREFAKENEIGVWSWHNIANNEIKVHLNANLTKLYKVSFDLDRAQRINSFLRRPKLIVTQFMPLNDAIKAPSRPNETEKKNVASAMQATYYSGLLASNHKRLQEMSESIRCEGPKWIKGADFNNNDFPDEESLKILVREFEKLGFVECGINFTKGEFKLDLLER